MKKYTILDSTGQKKIVYAPNMKKALRYVGDCEKTVKDSKVKDEDDYFYFDADEDDRSLDDYKRIMKQCGLTITKVKGNNREAFIYYRGSSSAEQKAAKMLGISLDDSVKDSKVKDIDANIVDKLIAEEEKAVMDYKEALMADSDLSANAVYAHILAEELEHLEELRSLKEQSVSDGNVAEKKLDDSIHDGLSEAKDLVKQAGFKVVRVYGTDNEPYITVDWNGSYSELQKKVRELKSKAKAIGYNNVYADDDDICFSKY